MHWVRNWWPVWLIVGLAVIAAVVMTPQVMAQGGYPPTSTLVRQLQPVATPAPVSGFSNGAKVIVLYNGAVTVAGTVTGSAVNIIGGNRVDLQVVVDQPATPNPLTVRLQFSNDQVNWAEGPTLVTANVQDVNEMRQLPMMGSYVRMQATGENAGRVQVRLIGVLK